MPGAVGCSSGCRGRPSCPGGTGSTPSWAFPSSSTWTRSPGPSPSRWGRPRRRGVRTICPRRGGSSAARRSGAAFSRPRQHCGGTRRAHEPTQRLEDVTVNAPASVVWVLPDKLGGVAVNVADVLAHRASRGPAHHVVLTDNRLSHDVRFDDRMRVDGLHRVQYTLPSENLHAVLRRLARAVPPGPGVLVANDWLELAMLSIHDPGRMVIFILHGDYDYYYDLAVAHEPLISAFVVLTRFGHEHLLQLLPHRRETIFHQPFGVPRAARLRSEGPATCRAGSVTSSSPDARVSCLDPGTSRSSPRPSVRSPRIGDVSRQ